MSGMFYSGEALLKQALDKFVAVGNAGDQEEKYHVIFSSKPTETNDGPIEVIFPAMSTLPKSE